MDPKETERFNKILINGYEDLLKAKPENPQAHFINYLMSTLPTDLQATEPDLYNFCVQYRETQDDQTNSKE